MNDGVRVLVVLALVLATGAFTLAEYALLTVRRWRMQELAHAGDRRAATVLRLMDEPLRFIGTIQLGISALGILVGAVGEPVLRGALDPPLPLGASFAVGVVAMTFLSVLIGDLVPKAVALQRAERLARTLAPAVAALEWLAFPVVWLLQSAATALLRPLRLKPPGLGAAVRSEQDLRGILGEAEESGVIEEAQEEMLYNVFDFAAAEASAVMVPRVRVAALPAELTAHAALARVVDAPYTRHPVYEGDLDHVIGLLDVRDLLTVVHRGTGADVTIAALMRPVKLVPATKDLGALLAELRRDRQKLAVVVDAAGAMVGIVTLQDLLEEIVGEIDAEFTLPDETLEWTDGRTVRVAGTFPVDDFNDRFGVALPLTRFHTLAGLAFDRLGHVARTGDELDVGGIRLRVLAVDGPRVRLLEARLPVRT